MAKPGITSEGNLPQRRIGLTCRRSLSRNAVRHRPCAERAEAGPGRGLSMLKHSLETAKKKVKELEGQLNQK